MLLLLLAVINNTKKGSDSKKKNLKKVIFEEFFFSKLDRNFSVKEENYYIKNEITESAVTKLQIQKKVTAAAMIHCGPSQ